MKSVDFRNDPMFLRNQFARDGTFEMPVIKKTKLSLDNIEFIGYDKLNEGQTEKIVHFFLDDYKFEVLWKDPEPRIEKLKEYRAVLSPQFSMYTEMPVAVQIYQVFKSRWSGAYFQSKGLKVIPSLVWGEADTFWFSFDGIDPGSVVAVSTVGMRTEKQLFMAGYKEMLRRIKPQAIICYGEPFEEMEGKLIVVDYAKTNNLTAEKTFTKHITKYIHGCIEKGGGSAGGSGGRNTLSTKPAQVKHMFSDRPGHLPDTVENRALLESVANNPENYLGVDSLNTQWYAQTQSDGSQIWARVWDGSIFNGGINETPRSWNPVTGLNNNPFEQGVRK